MAKAVNGSVLEALLSLASRKADGGAKKISLAAIVKRSGKKKAEVEAILERNKEALAFDGTSVTGATLVALAGRRGLIVRMTEGVASGCYRRTFWSKGKRLESFNLDSRDDDKRSDAFLRELKDEGKIVCQTLTDLPVCIARQVWDEDGALSD